MSEALPPLTKERYLNNEDLAKILDCSLQTVARLTKKGILPEPNRFSRKMVRWRESDVTRFLMERHNHDASISKDY
jgi:predicted DNA-binding transcriptional regulator AlpA